MVLSKILVPATLLTALLAGCDKAEAPPEPRTSGAQTGAQTGSTTTVPGAATPSAATNTVPPATSGGQAGASPATSGGQAGAGASMPSQANPATLSQGQESSAMPLEGQANNYSPAETASQRSSATADNKAKGEEPK